MVWGFLQPGYVRWAPPPDSQNHFNHCLNAISSSALFTHLLNDWGLQSSSVCAAHCLHPRWTSSCNRNSRSILSQVCCLVATFCTTQSTTSSNVRWRQQSHLQFWNQHHSATVTAKYQTAWRLCHGLVVAVWNGILPIPTHWLQAIWAQLLLVRARQIPMFGTAKSPNTACSLSTLCDFMPIADIVPTAELFCFISCNRILPIFTGYSIDLSSEVRDIWLGRFSWFQLVNAFLQMLDIIL